MLISIAGSQGSGKTTVLKKLKEKGFKIIERKTSRSILEDWGVSLNQVNNDRDLTIRFQNEIVDRKLQDEYFATQSSDIYITERTYADLFTYALVSIGKDNDFSDWLKDYYEKCIAVQQSYTMVYYLKAGHFQPENDGVRGISIHYSRMIDLVMQDITTQMTSPSKINLIDTPCLHQRIAIIESQVNCL
jgi:predicted ATPase